MSGGKELVLDTLRRATSQEAEILKPAELQLQEWETEPGFYSTLVEVRHVITLQNLYFFQCSKRGNIP